MTEWPPVDEAFVSDRLEDALVRLDDNPDAAREHIRAALAELESERAVDTSV